MIRHPFLDKRTTITNIAEKQIQPNAVDIVCDRIFEIKDTPCVLTSTEKVHRTKWEVQPTGTGRFYLEMGKRYDVVSNSEVCVAHGQAGIIIIRSTLNRNGIFATSGLYDSGFHGLVGFCLHVEGGPLILERGVSVAQFVTFDAETFRAYDGTYGITGEHDKIYQKT